MTALQAVPSGREVQSARTARTIAAATTTYTKAKEIVITVAGGYNIKYRLVTDNGTSGGVYGLVYRIRNGVATAVGTENQNGSTAGTDTLYVEDIWGWEVGDSCAIYCKSPGGSSAGQVKGFVLGAELAPAPPGIPYGRVVTDTNV